MICEGSTRSGKRCNRLCSEGEYCWQHSQSGGGKINKRPAEVNDRIKKTINSIINRKLELISYDQDDLKRNKILLKKEEEVLLSLIHI